MLDPHFAGVGEHGTEQGPGRPAAAAVGPGGDIEDMKLVDDVPGDEQGDDVACALAGFGIARDPQARPGTCKLVAQLGGIEEGRVLQPFDGGNVSVDHQVDPEGRLHRVPRFIAHGLWGRGHGRREGAGRVAIAQARRWRGEGSPSLARWPRRRGRPLRDERSQRTDEQLLGSPTPSTPRATRGSGAVVAFER